MKAITADYRHAELSAVDRAICDFAVKLTHSPGSIRERDVESFRQAGLSDRAINDVVQVAAYFNYINRVADGLGVDLEPGMVRGVSHVE